MNASGSFPSGRASSSGGENPGPSGVWTSLQPGITMAAAPRPSRLTNPRRLIWGDPLPASCRQVHSAGGMAVSGTARPAPEREQPSGRGGWTAPDRFRASGSAGRVAGRAAG